MKCVLSIDQGTTGSRAILFDRDGRERGRAYREFRQYYPRPGEVEHDPLELWESVRTVVGEALNRAKIRPEDVAAVGIANQRETVVLWNRKTGEPIRPAIVWQDRRTAPLCKTLRADGLESLFRQKTGLLIDPYFSGTKLTWMLDQTPGARRAAENGELAFGTIDAWLVWKLTAGERHVTDVANASRTLLFNLHTLDWDEELLDVLRIPPSLLPEALPSDALFGRVSPKTLGGVRAPIAGLAGDQQAALFGQGCFAPGSTKNTYGTGCFLLMNVGEKPAISRHRLLSTVAWRREDEAPRYALEGSVFVGGAVVQWLRDQLGVIDRAADVEALAASVPDSAGVVFVPAFAGLGAPHWDAAARGLLLGLTRGVGKAHVARAALDAICHQSLDVLRAMERDAGTTMDSLRVDGGAAANDLLMQTQADLLQRPVVRPENVETTALGAAALAGLSVGFWDAPETVLSREDRCRIFQPRISADEATARHARWLRALERSKAWEETTNPK